ncbi:MAG: hypothetical protein QNJ53_16360 [Pleurocapsa sp. MO_192.B19]|nr:hypothetical protein [Pleurocapsa sp. MO_192.B19]
MVDHIFVLGRRAQGSKGVEVTWGLGEDGGDREEAKTNSSLLTPHSSLLTPHSSLRTTNCVLFN